MATFDLYYTIEYGQRLRIGYKQASSSGPYNYLPDFPTPEESPYEITLPTGTYDLELTTVCPNCAGNKYSDAYLTTITVP